MKIFTISALLFLACCIIPFNGHALNGESKIGTQIKTIKTSGSIGILYGWNYVHYESQSFFVGGAGYTGQLTGSQPGSFSYGGLSAGFDWTLSPRANLQISLLSGGAGGFKIGDVSSGGIVIEPALTYTISFGKQIRVAVGAGYLWMPSSKDFTGTSALIGFEFVFNRRARVATKKSATAKRK